jgi:diaminohydroxyphosphoribosylaminopyrimidine deaminase/5-amino-6-(5-phosphoribosylamino)uracil reductase
VLAREAARDLAGYLTRRVSNRAHVTLKLAVSANGKIGRRDGRQVLITGEIARRQVHALRAQSDVILIGIGTAINDDPELTCRLPVLRTGLRSGLFSIRSSGCRSPRGWCATAREVPVWVATAAAQDHPARAELAAGRRVYRLRNP